MQAKTYLPSEELCSFIKSYSFVRIDNSANKHSVQYILPEGNFEIIYQIDGKMDQLSSDLGSWEVYPESCFCGLFDVLYKIQPVGICQFVRVQFQPGKFHLFNFAQNQNQSNQNIRRKDFYPNNQSDFFYRLSMEENRLESLQMLNDYFLSHLQKDPSYNQVMVGQAIALITETKGLIRIHDLANNMRVSLSNFRRQFKSQVGISPKKFATIQRIHHITTQIDQQNQINLTQLAHEMNYYDQSHFIKDVKNVCGVAPGHLNRPEFNLRRALANA